MATDTEDSQVGSPATEDCPSQYHCVVSSRWQADILQRNAPPLEPGRVESVITLLLHSRKTARKSVKLIDTSFLFASGTMWACEASLNPRTLAAARSILKQRGPTHSTLSSHQAWRHITSEHAIDTLAQLVAIRGVPKRPSCHHNSQEFNLSRDQVVAKQLGRYRVLHHTTVAMAHGLRESLNRKLPDDDPHHAGLARNRNMSSRA